ncbi:chloramphenicol phosphotransferase CPT family protein [Arthrobacter sp. zg-Y769]|uniref:chloramphenicol phosphotransferase CPT family protein n=1 Tax=Arthrobacter sp. zg-Y769 TaxID=2894191 RepID=UPI001E464278|nr:chloramphenicol phosphotransferase CPT family protein [Arthrobacter sp. zg-Y769]MCC9205010.1 chloramphenicol phosphotransferase CPT family protein [Arthrobacter sp. zg-Y769]
MSPDPIPQVIVLNGGSSSGKSSIARALQELLPGIWLTFGVDTFIDALPDRGDSPRAGITYEPDGTISFTAEHRDLERAWYMGLSNMARSGARLILDEVVLSGGAGQERLRATFSGIAMMWVGVRCNSDVAAFREGQRSDRVEGMARHQALTVHTGVAYDVVVDTTNRKTEACARDIANLLRSGSLL